jgi:c-di-GMP-binding flagellar brake protein YcgR
MSDSSLTNLVKSIKDSQNAKIKMQTTGGQEVHLDCIYKESIAPNFFVVFPPGKIPTTLDNKKKCIISLHDESGESIALTAKIIEVASDRSIELTATTTIDPASLREYFRVDFRTTIKLSYETSSNTDGARNWSFTGQSLDLSGSGILGIFPEEARNKHHIFIELDLTHPQKKIICIGHVVRTRRLRGGRWHIALHFDDINQKNRDAIITNCLWEQRRQLREKIQTS